ncbi:MAG: tRNA glutamyl-Q(34) synthetase GluQRS, partial [Colwellia sp.]|nr:tRNA glutamyl-Q(34) synthetase GluQRS [Colwellia sp.]
RGCDLLEPTARQLTLYQTLNASFLPCTTPQYGHIPLAITRQGYKLSKQNKAPAINNKKPQPALIAALAFLGQSPEPELAGASVAEIIQWAIKNWQRSRVPNKVEINID